MRKVLIFILAGVLFTAACATLPAGEQRNPVAPTEAATPSEAQTGKPGSNQAEGIVIEFRRSGGFAGVEETWTVYSDGRVTATGMGNSNSQIESMQVPPEAVGDLLGEIEGLGFFELTGNYMPLDTCCDRFTYEVVVYNGDKVHRVSTIDAAPDVPPTLWQVIDAISQFVEQSRG